MNNRKVTYGEYRQRHLAEAMGEEEQGFYQNPEAKPETDMLMEQYSQLEEELQQIKPETPEYVDHVNTMGQVMEQLMQLNPTAPVVGEAQRLGRLAGPVGRLPEADPYYDESGDSGVQQWYDYKWGGELPEWWQRDQPEEDILVKPSPNDILQWGEMEGPGDPDPDVGYYMKQRPYQGPIEPGPQEVSNQDAAMNYTQYAAKRPAPSMDISRYPQVAAEQTMSDADPEDQQAHDDLIELAGVYGLKLGSTKSGKLVVQGGKLSPWRMDFADYAEAMRWAKANPGKLAAR